MAATTRGSYRACADHGQGRHKTKASSNARLCDQIVAARVAYLGKGVVLAYHAHVGPARAERCPECGPDARVGALHRESLLLQEVSQQLVRLDLLEGQFWVPPDLSAELLQFTPEAVDGCRCSGPHGGVNQSGHVRGEQLAFLGEPERTSNLMRSCI